MCGTPRRGGVWFEMIHVCTEAVNKKKFSEFMMVVQVKSMQIRSLLGEGHERENPDQRLRSDGGRRCRLVGQRQESIKGTPCTARNNPKKGLSFTVAIRPSQALWYHALAQEFGEEPVCEQSAMYVRGQCEALSLRVMGPLTNPFVNGASRSRECATKNIRRRGKNGCFSGPPESSPTDTELDTTQG